MISVSINYIIYIILQHYLTLCCMWFLTYIHERYILIFFIAYYNGEFAKNFMTSMDFLTPIILIFSRIVWHQFRSITSNWMKYNKLLKR